MANYELNGDAVRNAERLIGNGKVDSSTEWSDGQPSTDDENEFIDEHGYEAFGEWHLAIDTKPVRRRKAGTPSRSATSRRCIATGSTAQSSVLPNTSTTRSSGRPTTCSRS